MLFCILQTMKFAQIFSYKIMEWFGFRVKIHVINNWESVDFLILHLFINLTSLLLEWPMLGAIQTCQIPMKTSEEKKGIICVNIRNVERKTRNAKNHFLFHSLPWKKNFLFRSFLFIIDERNPSVYYTIVLQYEILSCFYLRTGWVYQSINYATSSRHKQQRWLLIEWKYSAITL